jgi:hypothetical protein
MKVVDALALTNKISRIYKCGQHYGLAKKQEVALAFLQLQEEQVMLVPPIVWVAKRAKVGWHYADFLVMEELMNSDKSQANLIDPSLIHHIKTANNSKYRCFLLHKEEMFLLSLRTEYGRRPNISYIHKLFLAYQRIVSSSFLSL